MGNHISMCLSSLKESVKLRTKDTSTSLPQEGQHISIRTFRELNQVRTSKHTSTKTETPYNGGLSRLMVEVPEEVAKMLTTHVRRH
ncbi:C4 protein [Soybean mild mottle virus]|uniref:C4 protein n=1 Tax=Soybean mild mottle virus TaxID=761701 RepID=D6MTW4_9GEMI|nr:C4 protein [Soybean mild mottle virus]ADG36414.1 C4 protein [Soybean mild mottle virus]